MLETEEQIEHVVMLLNEKLLGIVIGILFGTGLFLVTNFLLLKGGEHIGAHLALLAVFFPGYRVTFLGSLIGFLYMFIVGFLTGMVVGAVYNKLAKT
jgi:ABC-type antimicrobial peptide transport system permease subunit